MGVTPSCSIMRRYLSATPAVMSVWMMPGRTSKTGMPSPARRSAKSFVTMEIPALDTQYSPREGEEA